MTDLTGLPALDVAIGMFFMFFLLGVVCSAINEAIANVLAQRSGTMLTALRSMLAEDEALPRRSRQRKGLGTPTAAEPVAPGDSSLLVQLLDHPLLRSQVDETAWTNMRRWIPSYLDGRVFAVALLDALARRGGPGDLVGRVSQAVGELGNPHLEHVLEPMLRDAAGDADRLRDGVERWFDTTMTRASAWYKRRSQVHMWGICLVVAVGLNADAGQVANSLWKDPVVRASIAAQAQAAAESGDRTDLGGAHPDDTLTARVQRVEQLALPLGWSTEKADPRWPDDGAGWIAKAMGLLATTFALTLGAPFWFDLLRRASALRGGGRTQPPSSPSGALTGP